MILHRVMESVKCQRVAATGSFCVQLLCKILMRGLFEPVPVGNHNRSEADVDSSCRGIIQPVFRFVFFSSVTHW